MHELRQHEWVQLRATRMHYLFFDESYAHRSPGKLAFAGWAVEQDRFNRRPKRQRELSRTPVLNSIDVMLGDLDAWAVLIKVSLDPSLFRSGEIDGTDDVARMPRTDNIWATCSTFLITKLLTGFFTRREELATIDVYHDPKSLKPDLDEALGKSLRGSVVQTAKNVSAAFGSKLFEKLNIRRIEPVAKPSDFSSADKFQVGVWVSDRLCSYADAVEAGHFSRIRSYDVSEEVRRTIQQYDGKRFEDD
jgi:hypothetical protein